MWNFMNNDSHYLTLEPGKGLLDTGAAKGMLSIGTLRDYAVKVLAPAHLWFVILPENQNIKAAGIGGSAKVLFEAMLPIGLGGVPGVLKVTVVADAGNHQIPLLIPQPLIKALGGRILTDLQVVQWTACAGGAESAVEELPSNHSAVSVCEGLHAFADELPDAWKYAFPKGGTL